MTAQDAPEIQTATHILDDAWAELRKSLFVQQQRGEPLTQIPDLSLAEAQRRSEVGKRLLDRLNSLDPGILPYDLRLSLRVLRFRAATWAKEADFYWYVIDPLGVGFFGMFLPTAYCGGFLLNYVHRQLSRHSFNDEADRDRYRELILDYARLIDAFTERTSGQAERGIRMPKAQIIAGRRLVQSLLDRAPQHLGVVAAGKDSVPASGTLEQEISQLIASRVQPAFARLLETLSEQYYLRAPDHVGIGQYPEGRAIYEQLVKLHTTLDLTPEALHRTGLERMAEVRADMEAICKQPRGKEHEPTFLTRIAEDPRWRATTGDAVRTVFQRYMDRLSPHLPDLFERLPKSPFTVEPLPEALQSAMTYGYYEGPGRVCEPGTYFFNAAHLTTRPLISVGALAYHELVPGHHIHFASQLENQSLHPLRAHSFVNAYNEGWAEYAVALASELGMFERAEERYGRLTREAHGISRLIVDTGMNVLGWSLEQAREYLRTHTEMSELEIASESLRYAADLPGQALAYKVGDRVILELRARMQKALGPHFDLRKFHTCILGPGALPLPDLSWHVESEIGRFAGKPS